MGLGNYFKDIKAGLTSAFEGMSISLASLFVRPVTVQYPDVDVKSDEAMRENYNGPLRGMPDNYRGLLDVDLEICISCKLCEKACPIDCILIEDVKIDKKQIVGRNGKSTMKMKSPIQFDIDNSKCMFCGLCVDPCPTGAIVHTNEFEFNRSDRSQLISRFVKADDRAQLKVRGAEIAIEDAKAKAEKAAKKKAEAEAKAKEEEEASKDQSEAKGTKE
ncbi:MAG: NADH-quinone oxidoreductase subunit I [Planctomycetes bacterium]|nr:NADH-quinone oxidoreductase subunit I [Planctomycetota bacterium]